MALYTVGAKASLWRALGGATAGIRDKNSIKPVYTLKRDLYLKPKSSIYNSIDLNIT